MTTGIATCRILVGDVREQLALLPEQSVQMAVTSPPYWGLRSYLSADHPLKFREIGTESTPADYVASLVATFQAVRRVLKPDGTLWVNLGDAYSRGDRSRFPNDALRGISSTKTGVVAAQGGFGAGGVADRPAKNLLMIPARFALAMQDAGWILRSRIIWHKPNALPSPTQDRPTNSYEEVFLFVLSDRPRFWVHRDRPYGDRVMHRPEPDYRWIHRETGMEQKTDPGDPAHWRRINLWRSGDYYYDGDAIAEPAVVGDHGSYFDRGKTGHHANQGSDHRPKDKQRASGLRLYSGFNDRWQAQMTKPGMRQRRDVWSIPTTGFAGAHYAVFPEKLIEPMIIAGCPEGGTVLDPFAGSGTTLAVANRLGRHAIGIELNPEYLAMIDDRTRQSHWVFAGD